MVQASMRGCLLSKLHIYAVLAAVAHFPINQGKPLVSAGRAQYFKYKSVHHMQEYFQSRTSLSVDDAQVILDILFMFARELYIRDYITAWKHMRIASKLIESISSSDFDKYVRHGRQASELLLAMETLKAPTLLLDWDPGEFPVESWKRITASTIPVGHALLQASLCGLTCPGLDSVLADVPAWARVNQYTLNNPTQPDLRWVNYRGNALMHRLLSLTEILSEDIGSQAVRITLIILLGCVISRIGLLRSGKLNATRLYSLLKNCDYISCVMPDEMELWTLTIGYMVSTAGSDEQKWFEMRSARHATLLTSYEDLEALMRKHLLLDLHRPSLEHFYDAFAPTSTSV